MDYGNYSGYILTLIIGVLGAKFWEFFFKFKGEENVIEQQNLELLITKVYGGLIAEFKESHLRNEGKIFALENKVEKQGVKIERLDKKVTIYENHLLEGNKKDKALVLRTNLQLEIKPNLI